MVIAYFQPGFGVLGGALFGKHFRVVIFYEDHHHHLTICLPFNAFSLLS